MFIILLLLGVITDFPLRIIGFNPLIISKDSLYTVLLLTALASSLPFELSSLLVLLLYVLGVGEDLEEALGVDEVAVGGGGLGLGQGLQGMEETLGQVAALVEGLRVGGWAVGE